MAINNLKNIIKNFINKLDKKQFIISIIFLFTLSTIYSAMYNIPYLNRFNYSTGIFILFFIVSILRDFIIWYVAFLNRWLFAFFAIYTFTASGGLKYLYNHVNMGLNIGTFEIIFSTNFTEAAGIINPTLLLLFATGALVGSIFTFIRFKYIKIKPYANQILILTISIVMLIFGLMPEKYLKHEKHKQSIEGLTAVGGDLEILPEKMYENFYHLARNNIMLRYMFHKRQTLALPEAEKVNNDESIVVFVLTDALRADHLSINGYERKTTPYMEKNNFLSFKEMYACETSTTRSVPCLLTDMRRRQERYQFLNEYSVFNVFKAAGYYTSFISAQTAITTADYGQQIVAGDADYVFFNNEYSVGHDIELLKYFDEVMAKDNNHKLIVLQLNGSHWDYNSKFDNDKALWKPLCGNFALDCPASHLKNSYDNTIVETDKLLNTLVEKLKDKNAIIFFSSDYGQSLGEGGLRLHSHERLHIKEVGVVPFAVWFSEKAKKQVDISNISGNLGKILTHDSIFHSMIGCANIDTSLLDNSLNICSKSLVSAPDEFKNYIPKPIE